MFVGVDGCKAGWFAVVLVKDADWKVNVFPDVSSFWDEYRTASVILIDIPIGLKDEGSQERLCDIEARKLLGRPRGSSVFRVPCRAAIYAKIEEASRINRQQTGKGVSPYAVGIIPKIREIDVFISEEKSARSRIREVHPELCFWALAGGQMMKYSKRTEAGFLERLRLLQSVYPHAEEVIDCALSIYRRRQVAKDDVLDALVAAITAKLSFKRGLASVPKRAEFDSQGLRMEMVYLSRD